jgi:hypothetical protein
MKTDGALRSGVKWRQRNNDHGPDGSQTIDKLKRPGQPQGGGGRQE